MEELAVLVNRTLGGDLTAYAGLVRRFQDMALGYAYSLVGDFHLAEDAAQEAFLGAYLDLATLREPAAFPGWFRRIVYKHCDRITRRKGASLVPLDAVGEIGSQEKGPDLLLDELEVRDQVAVALRSLPEHQRLVTSLFYIGDLSHREIAAFLGTPVQTVKNRLYAARKRLKKELIDMAKERLQSQRPSRNEDFVVHIMDELVDLSDRGIQAILREVDHKDCTTALRGATREVREKILGNMSERVRNFIEAKIQELEDGDGDEAEVQRAQEVFMDVFRRIQPRHPNTPESYLAKKKSLRERLETKAVSQMDLDELAELYADMTVVVSMEGMLALIEFEDIIRRDQNDKLLGAGLTLTIGGRGGEIAADILEKRKHTLLRELETRCDLIIEGTLELQRRLSDGPMRAKLKARYSLSDDYIY